MKPLNCFTQFLSLSIEDRRLVYDMVNRAIAQDLWVLFLVEAKNHKLHIIESITANDEEHAEQLRSHDSQLLMNPNELYRSLHLQHFNYAAGHISSMRKFPMLMHSKWQYDAMPGDQKIIVRQALKVLKETDFLVSITLEWANNQLKVVDVMSIPNSRPKREGYFLPSYLEKEII